MKVIMLEAFRHSTWAMKQLLATCRGLTMAQLTGPGSAADMEGRGGKDWSRERNIVAIFNHIIRSDRGYVSRRGDRPEWAESEEDSDHFDELERRAEENALVWERFLSELIDPRKLLVLDEGAYEAEQSVLLVQALYHIHIHLEQVSAILIRLGVEPPDLQAWSYAEATDQARPRPT